MYDIGVDGSLSKMTDFVSTGSGSPIAYGVLETLYNNEISVKEGVVLAKKAINSAIQRDMPTGDGIDVFTITESGAQKVETQHLVKKIE